MYMEANDLARNYVCNPAQSYRQYYALYGLVRLGGPDEAELLPEEEGVAYRVAERRSTGDWLQSLSLGLLLSVSSTTIAVERCVAPSRYAVEQKQREFAERADNQIRSAAAEQEAEQARARARQRAEEARRAAEEARRRQE